jgi:DNA (cytosine-5)-methyltransferase 1
MGFEKSLEAGFKIPVSDTQSYKQFGNSVVVPVFEAVAKQMKTAIYGAVEQESVRFSIQRELALREHSAKYAAGGA